jgi:hypothetical protein
MSNSSIPITVDLVLNLISVVFDIFVLLNCLVFFSVIIYRLIRINIKSILQITHVSVPTLMKIFNLLLTSKKHRSVDIKRIYSFQSLVFYFGTMVFLHSLALCELAIQRNYGFIDHLFAFMYLSLVNIYVYSLVYYHYSLFLILYIKFQTKHIVVLHPHLFILYYIQK